MRCLTSELLKVLPHLSLTKNMKNNYTQAKTKTGKPRTPSRQTHKNAVMRCYVWKFGQYARVSRFRKHAPV